MEKETITIEEVPSDLMPSMNLNVQQEENNEIANLIDDKVLLGIYDEIINNIREDRNQTDEYLSNFVNLVINDGDSTSASKEALVNLVKIKADMSDKMAKIAELMTRMKMKDKDTFPRYLAAKQENHINIGGKTNKRAMLEAIHKLQKKEKEA